MAHNSVYDDKKHIFDSNHSIIIKSPDFIFRSKHILYILCSFSVCFPLEFQFIPAVGTELFRVGEVCAEEGQGKWLVVGIQLIWDQRKFATISGTMIVNVDSTF